LNFPTFDKYYKSGASSTEKRRCGRTARLPDEIEHPIAAAAQRIAGKSKDFGFFDSGHIFSMLQLPMGFGIRCRPAGRHEDPDGAWTTMHDHHFISYRPVAFSLTRRHPGP
jgi:hypothetical protein